MANSEWSQIFAITLATIFLCNNNFTFATDPFVQQEHDRIDRPLPGQNFNISFEHYSGYITVNEDAGRNLFYWFIQADHVDPTSKPLLLWLNGGPGCSSIAYGEAEEIGPFHINSDGKNLHFNPYYWNQAEDNLIFLLKWFERFPQYKKTDFFISGESYAGHYIPQLSQVIVKYNSATKQDSINFKGFLVGNAVTDDFHDQLGIFEFLWTNGMISDQTFKLLNLLCDFQSFEHPSKSCERILEIADKEMGNIDPFSIFTPPCHENDNQPDRRKHSFGRLRGVYDPCTENHSNIYFNRPEVQRALHVNPDHKPDKWQTCSDVVGTNWKDSPRSVLNIYRELIPTGLRIWIFSGNTDAIIPVTSTRYSINALKLPTVSPWRAWYDDGEVGGWTQEYAGLTFVNVRGAGHEVPLHRPKLALTLIKAFLEGTSMPTLEPRTLTATI
ncbi:serine carboxypeptidase II-2 isoform X2 [Medicago truncatula]|uniref:serine carboxypeptidase II-2 isoform X2 n=1 Tax=Medicago truncatula TaxID=3880 RepID=UPI001967B36B|nr:serine carboxypeptidase II-2 isoform X2 [Medicago truncatula]